MEQGQPTVNMDILHLQALRAVIALATSSELDEFESISLSGDFELYKRWAQRGVEDANKTSNGEK